MPPIQPNYQSPQVPTPQQPQYTPPPQPQYTPPQPQFTAPQPPVEPKRNTLVWVLAGVLLLVLIILGYLFFSNRPVNQEVATPSQSGSNSPFGQVPIQTNTTGSASCPDNNDDCFLAAANSCTPTTLKTVTIGITNKHEIFGLDGGLCRYQLTYLGGTVVFSQKLIDLSRQDGATEADIQNGIKFWQSAADDSKGMKYDCKSTQAELIASLQDIFKINAASENGDSVIDSNSPSSKFLNSSKCVPTRS